MILTIKKFSNNFNLLLVGGFNMFKIDWLSLTGSNSTKILL